MSNGKHETYLEGALENFQIMKPSSVWQNPVVHKKRLLVVDSTVFSHVFFHSAKMGQPREIDNS